MRRKILILSLFFLFISSSVFAETVVLKSGAVLDGEIIERTDEYIKIRTWGTYMTYSLDDVESIGEGRESLPRVGNASTQQKIHQAVDTTGNYDEELFLCLLVILSLGII